MKKVQYDNNPTAIEAVGNGSYLYRWGSAPVTKEEQTLYECYEVVVWSPISANKITEVVIEALWGNGVEEKLLNDYNAAVLGILPTTFKETYKEFLQERKAVKEQIEKDYEAWIAK